MSASEDQYRGCLVGLALGDALGAVHEGGPIERLLWRFIGRTPDGLKRFTDDTQMAVDLVESIVACGAVNQDDIAIRFARSYRWDRGYGPGAARILKGIRSGTPWRDASRSVYAGGSFGNGGAMRSPVLGLFFHQTPERIASATRLATEITHAHPLGIEGAVLIAEATAHALDGSDGSTLLELAQPSATSSEFSTRLEVARNWLETGAAATSADVRSKLGMGITAPGSCVTALYLAARFLGEPIGRLFEFAAHAGGDVDTVSAMAGAIWGASNGFAKLPAPAVSAIEGSVRISELAAQLFELAERAASNNG